MFFVSNVHEYAFWPHEKQRKVEQNTSTMMITAEFNETLTTCDCKLTEWYKFPR